jgi:hypothetical protein
MKKIISMSKWDMCVKKEYNRVKKTCTITSPWVSNIRPPKGTNPQLWDKDELARIPKVGGKTIDKLKLLNITRVKHLKNLALAQVTAIVNAGLPQPSIEAAASKCDAALPGAYDVPMVDHRKHDNPYKSRWSNDFEQRLCSASALKPFVCIMSLVTWIANKSRRMMEGTVHEKDWYFYHNAL